MGSRALPVPAGLHQAAVFGAIDTVRVLLGSGWGCLHWKWVLSLTKERVSYVAAREGTQDVLLPLALQGGAMRLFERGL